MKRITIDGKEYTFEFTIEATLYDECTIKAMESFVDAGAAQADANDNDVKGAMMHVIGSMAGAPHRALTFFYAGLLEHHGSNGDGSVPSKEAAKALVVKYMKEYQKSWYDVLKEMTDLMAEDSFFDLIGLNEMMDNLTKNEQTEAKKPRKRTTSKSSTTD